MRAVGPKREALGREEYHNTNFSPHPIPKILHHTAPNREEYSDINPSTPEGVKISNTLFTR